MQLQLVLQHDVLSFLTGDGVIGALSGSSLPHPALAIKSDDLPPRLVQAIEGRLLREWEAQQLLKRQGGLNTMTTVGNAVIGRLCLDAPVKALESGFVSHITCMPELLERYNSVDAGGATVRRCAIINQRADDPPPLVATGEETRPPADASTSPQPSSVRDPPIQTPRRGGPHSSEARHGTTATTTSHRPQSPLERRRQEASPPRGVPPAALMRGADVAHDLLYLERRYRSAFKQLTPPTPGEGPSGGWWRRGPAVPLPPSGLKQPQRRTTPVGGQGEDCRPKPDIQPDQQPSGDVPHQRTVTPTPSTSAEAPPRRNSASAGLMMPATPSFPSRATFSLNLVPTDPDWTPLRGGSSLLLILSLQQVFRPPPVALSRTSPQTTTPLSPPGAPMQAPAAPKLQQMPAPACAAPLPSTTSSSAASSSASSITASAAVLAALRGIHPPPPPRIASLQHQPLSPPPPLKNSGIGGPPGVAHSAACREPKDYYPSGGETPGHPHPSTEALPRPSSPPHRSAHQGGGVLSRGGGERSSSGCYPEVNPPEVNPEVNSSGQETLYRLSLRVESGGATGVPSWLASYLTAELARSLVEGSAAAVVATSRSSAGPKGGDVPLDGPDGLGAREVEVKVGALALRRAILRLENYGGDMAARAEIEAVRNGERTRLGSTIPNNRREESFVGGAGDDVDDDDGFWSVGDPQGGSGDSDGGRSSSGGSSGAEEEDREEEALSDDGYGEGSGRAGVGGKGGLGADQRDDFFDLDDGFGTNGSGDGVGMRRTAVPRDDHVARGGFEGMEGEGQSDRSRGSSDSEEDAEDVGEGDGRGADEARFHGGGVGPLDQDPGGAAGMGAWHCVLEGLQLDYVEAAELIKAPFQVACGRCGKDGDMLITSEAVSSAPSGGGKGGGGQRPFETFGQCPSCHIPWHALARPRFVHGSSNILCALKLQGCVARDLLPCMMAVQCSSCSGVMTMREVQVGAHQERSCSSCHHRLALAFSAVSFIPRGPPAGAARGGAACSGTASKAAKGSGIRGGGGGGASDSVLRVGLPLPALGTCKHYRHSYRWLRFPCCGARYACDLCHEEATDHPMRWATRMACGYCSLEQPVSNQCVACGRKLACAASNPLGKATRFWEGGGGCRDTRFMTNKDAHKYRGKAKTKSAKSTRVGPKAWSKELKKDQKSEREAKDKSES